MIQNSVGTSYIDEFPDPRSVIDHIEPEFDLRARGLRYIEVLEAFATYIGDGLNAGDLRAATTAFWSASYAIGLSCCNGMNIEQCSATLGVESAVILTAARTFVAANHLKPPRHMASSNGSGNVNGRNGDSAPAL